MHNNGYYKGAFSICKLEIKNKLKSKHLVGKKWNKKNEN